MRQDSPVAAGKRQADIPHRHFRLHTQSDDEALPTYTDHPSLYKALERATDLFQDDREDSITMLENWLGNEVCPVTDVIYMAARRWEERQVKAKEELARITQRKIEDNPLYGEWG